MRIDIYTKVVVTVIAFLLGIIAVRPMVRPGVTAQAQGGFGGLQYSGPTGISFFDSRTGDIWFYESDNGKAYLHWRMTRPGAPLTK